MRIAPLLVVITGCSSAPVAQPPARPASPPPFHVHEQCPPDREGCVLSREITLDTAIATMTCPDRKPYSGTQRLRELEAQIDVPPGDAAPYVRRSLLAAESHARSCFDADNKSARIDVSFAIVNRRAQSFDPPISPCLQQALASLDVPADAQTSVRWTLDYVVQPASAVTPLNCSYDQ